MHDVSVCPLCPLKQARYTMGEQDKTMIQPAPRQAVQGMASFLRDGSRSEKCGHNNLAVVIVVAIVIWFL
jgi:hypothetical protein